jgi:MFS family permease
VDEQLIGRHRKLGAWSGIVYVVLVFGGWAVLGRFLIPPLEPSADAETIAQFFQESTTSIRIGMLVLMLSALVAIPFSATVSGIIGEVEKRRGFLTYSAVLGGAGLMILTFYPAIFYLVAAFRPDRSPELIMLMNDLAWLQLIGGISVFLALPIAVAVTAFVDKSANPVFPRWMGYFNAWVVVLIVPDQLIFFFHSGPFAWNGLFGLWVPAGVFALWFIVTAAVIVRHQPSVTGNPYSPAGDVSAADSYNGTGREGIQT